MKRLAMIILVLTLLQHSVTAEEPILSIGGISPGLVLDDSSVARLGLERYGPIMNIYQTASLLKAYRHESDPDLALATVGDRVQSVSGKELKIESTRTQALIKCDNEVSELIRHLGPPQRQDSNSMLWAFYGRPSLEVKRNGQRIESFEVREPSPGLSSKPWESFLKGK